MTKFLYILTTFISIVNIHAQEFSFQMNFKDAAGNVDSIILGYDPNGTEGIDAVLGETNIISVPLNTEFDVRITDEWKSNLLNIDATFHTKKQIINRECGGNFTINVIDIKTKHWPVTASWNKAVFNDPCRNGSVFTSINPGGWWDTGSPSDLYRAILSEISNVSFSSNYQIGSNENYSYVNDNADTIPVFWQTFADSVTLVNINEVPIVKSLKVYPNPTDQLVKIELASNFGVITSIQLSNIFGQCLLDTKNIELDLSDLSSGCYFVSVQNATGERLVEKLIKR